MQDFTVGYILDSQAPVTEPAAIAQLLPDSVYTHTFAVPANLGIPGEYRFKIFTSSAGDQNPTNDTLRVLRKKLPRRDAAMLQVWSLDNGICAPEYPIKVIFINAGPDTLHSLQLQVAVNGQAPQLLNWSGHLEQGEKDTVEVQLTGLIDGDNSIVVKTAMPNGLEDEMPGNDTYQRHFGVDFNFGWVTFILKTDSFPEQTTWNLSRQDGPVLYAGGPYLMQPQQEISETWCLSPGDCYIFTIYDSAGNGLVTPGGVSGHFSIYDHTGAVLGELSDPDFGINSQIFICLNLNCSFNFDLVVTDVSPPPYNSGSILVETTGGIPPLQYSKNNGQSFQTSPLFSGLLPGTYMITVKDFSGCTKTLTTKVNLVSGTDQLQDQHQITINPNPAADGIFQVVATGLPHSLDYLDVEIINATGKLVLSQSITVSGQNGKGVITLKNQPAGVYFARFQCGTGYQTVMLVKSQ